MIGRVRRFWRLLAAFWRLLRGLPGWLVWLAIERRMVIAERDRLRAMRREFRRELAELRGELAGARADHARLSREAVKRPPRIPWDARNVIERARIDHT